MVMEVSWWVEVTVLMVGEGTVVMDGWRDDGERGRYGGGVGTDGDLLDV